MRSPPRAGDSRLKRKPLAILALLALTGFGSLATFGCASKPRAPRPVARPLPPKTGPVAPARPKTSALDDAVAARLREGVEYGAWRDLGSWARYMAPTKTFVAEDGGVDVAFQFHGAEVAEKDWRQTGLNALIVSVTFPGWGSGVYKGGFSDPVKIGAILDDAMKRVGATHVRRMLLVSWSAGYAAMGIALGNAHYYALTDTAIVLDGLHADIIDGKPDERPLAIFERYAQDAVAGRKTMVVVHSSIVPPGYASTTQMAELLCASAGAKKVVEERRWPGPDAPVEYYHADAGNLHVRGFRGDGPKDHLDQVHLVDDLVREQVTPRWTRLAIEEARESADAGAGAKTP